MFNSDSGALPDMLEDTFSVEFLKCFLTVRSRMDLFRSHNVWKRSAFVVGTKLKPLDGTLISWGEKIFADRFTTE